MTPDATPRPLPLIDLHRHLEGSIRPETILALGDAHGIPLAPDLASLRPLVQVTDPTPDLMTFIDRMERAVSVLADLDACARVAYEAVEDAARDGLAYLELRFSPLFMAHTRGLPAAGVVAAVVDGVARGRRDHGLHTNLIGILSRTYGPEAAWRELEALLARREAIVALDLAGDELRFPGDLFVEHVRRGRAAGWHITVHAGEAAGPASVRQAIAALGAERLGHAVHAVDDRALLDLLAQRRVGIESSLTSNVQTSTVPAYARHPPRRFLDRGLLATINTDDPATSGITLSHELTVAAPAAGLSPARIRQAQANAVEIAFLEPADKHALRAVG